MGLEQFAASMIGVPFRDQGRDFAGCDCWGLIVLAYRAVYGIELPDLSDAYDHAGATPIVASVVESEKHAHWTEVTEPQAGDVVILKIKRLPVHIGLILGRTQMLHVHEGVDTCVERYRGLVWQHRIDGFFRHERRV